MGPMFCTSVGISNLQYGYILTQSVGRGGLIPLDWILLDTCSTNNVVHDHTLLTGREKCSKNQEMKIYTNCGSLNYDTSGLLKYLPIRFYLNDQSIANVLSLKYISDIPGCRIYMDKQVGPEIYVSYQGATLKFEQSINGLYYCRVHDFDVFHGSKNHTDNAISLLNTIPMKYSKACVKKANLARNLQKAMMWPSSSMMKQFIKNGPITNSSISEEDFDVADEVFGPSPEQIKGKATAPPKRSDRSSQVQLNQLKVNIEKNQIIY